MQETLATLRKVTSNVAQNPAEAKYRKLKLSNAKIIELIVNVPGALDSLRFAGWTEEMEESSPVMVLPPSVNLTMHDVKVIDGAIERLAKAKADETRARMAKAKAPPNADRDRIRAQMEADRAERAARGPVLQGSVAQKLPDNGGVTASLNGPIGGSAASPGHSAGGRVRCIHDAREWAAALAEGAKSGKLVVADFTATWCAAPKGICTPEDWFLK